MFHHIIKFFCIYKYCRKINIKSFSFLQDKNTFMGSLYFQLVDVFPYFKRFKLQKLVLEKKKKVPATQLVSHRGQYCHVFHLQGKMIETHRNRKVWCNVRAKDENSLEGRNYRMNEWKQHETKGKEGEEVRKDSSSASSWF